MNARLFFGKNDAPDLVTVDGCTFYVQAYVWLTTAACWRVLAFDQARFDGWIVARFTEAGDVDGGVVGGLSEGCARLQFDDRDCPHFHQKEW